ncbi:hypothetical protein EVAR_20979_1 [Eumeta japonica]|uniref:Uncharacterized protein n=1 Tax=Eumeta variegata TaxID=151549 RepID=A0A4C1V4X8_EUMVA|nr:hypothetical protein EVAR_20979_1 [Eumeta japonica]
MMTRRRCTARLVYAQGDSRVAKRRAPSSGTGSRVTTRDQSPVGPVPSPVQSPHRATTMVSSSQRLLSRHQSLDIEVPQSKRETLWCASTGG